MEKVEFKINGKTVFGKNGGSILKIAAENGIEIPNLCYDEKLKPFGACGICLVEIEGREKLVRACSAKAEAGISVLTDSE